MLIADHATDLVWMARGDRMKGKPLWAELGNHDVRKYSQTCSRKWLGSLVKG